VHGVKRRRIKRAPRRADPLGSTGDGVRIALAVDGTRGDVHPMLALGTALRARGHDAILCAPPDFADDAARGGMPFHPVGVSARAYLAEHAEFLHGSMRASMLAARDYLESNITQQFRALACAAQGADWILAAGVQLSAGSVAQAIGARHRFVAYCPSVLRSPHQTPFLVPRAELPRWMNRLAWWALIRIFGMTLSGVITRERAALGLPPVRDVYGLMRSDAPIFAVEDLLAAPAPDLAPSLQRVGCLHPFEPEPLPEKLGAFLDAGEPPVYIGFGSMTDPDPAASTRLVLDAVTRAGVRAVLSAGWAGLGDAPLPENVMVVGSLSHPALFQRVAAVVHHGGAGTTTTAARAGVPQILVPHVLDQFHWAARVTRLGLGPPALPRRGLSAERLAEAIASVRDNDLVGERAAELGQRLRTALRDRPHAADLLFPR
jgi:UDP:flavonoid glycosyltransferase YjiC (YdhE family)